MLTLFKAVNTSGCDQDFFEEETGFYLPKGNSDVFSKHKDEFRISILGQFKFLSAVSHRFTLAEKRQKRTKAIYAISSAVTVMYDTVQIKRSEDKKLLRT